MAVRIHCDACDTGAKPQIDSLAHLPKDWLGVVINRTWADPAGHEFHVCSVSCLLLLARKLQKGDDGWTVAATPRPHHD